MACFRPLKGYRSAIVNKKTGKRSIVWNAREGFYDMPVDLPCGQCIGCRLEKSRQWAMRCVHEAKLWEENTFITLTYDNDHLPANGSLVLEDFQKFMKRLRKHTGVKLRYYMCGEYGAKYQRPHYHAVIFGYDFPDKERIQKKQSDYPLYTSATLQKLWKKGFSIIGQMNFETAAYVARYVTKKITGEKAKDHYKGRRPEYANMSRKPGLARGWYDKYHTDVYNHDFVVIREKKMKPPRYYDQLFEIQDPTQYKKIKLNRKKQGLKNEDNNPYRMATKETVQELKYKQKIRKYEDEN